MTPEQIAASGSEHAEQAALFQWISQYCFDAAYDKRKPALQLLFAINNAVGRNSAIHGARNKAEGVKAGVPDLFLPVPRIPLPTDFDATRYNGLFIEMKQRKYKNHKNGGCSVEQLEWNAALRSQGYRVEVCFGWEHARDTLLAYLS